MLTLTKKTDYALIALTYLVQNPEGVATARAIAQRFKVPQSLLMNVLKALVQKGVLASVRGAKGGYSLAVAPEELSLYDLILAIEGPIKFVQCATPHVSDAAATCDLFQVCPVSAPARQIHERLENFLRRITLAEIVSGSCCCGGHEPAAVPLGIAR
jgi:Rrf2 family cysteine metabolism transcriptional repressor